jgi:hypothetical protein
MNMWGPDGDRPYIVQMGNGHSFMTDSEDVARFVYEAHNRELAEAQAELARVKAESLRVVPVGEPCRADEADRITGRILYSGRYCSLCSRWDDYFPLSVYDKITGDFMDKITNGTMVQPVRLERWT